MDLFAVLLIIILSLYEFRIVDNKAEFMSIKQTTSIKGLCALLVFFRHIVGYIQPDIYIRRMINVQDIMAQTIVMPFLFYSGYGIMHSLRYKEGYLKTFLKNRIGKLYLEFLLIWFSFLITDIVLHIPYNVKTVIQSLLIWESIGNSTWFLFAIISMYFLTWLSFTLVKNWRYSLILLFLGISIYYVIMYHLRTDTHWYDTIIAYYLGMLYCCLHDHKIKNKPSKTKISEHMNLQNSFGVYIAKVFLSGSLLIITLKKAATLFGVNGEYQLYVVLSTILCCIFLVIVCQRIILGNKALMWLGQHSFEIYMSQRIPMMIFQRIGLGTHKTLFAIVTLLCTLILAFLYKTAISKCPLFRDK